MDVINICEASAGIHILFNTSIVFVYDVVNEQN